MVCLSQKCDKEKNIGVYCREADFFWSLAPQKHKKGMLVKQHETEKTHYIMELLR